MTIINEHNYEAFLLDFAEGNLSAAQTNALFDFLAANPHLQEDFDLAFETGKLTEQDLMNFTKKEALLKDENTDRLQNLIIADLEGVATEKQQKELRDLSAQNESVKTEQRIFSKLILKEEATIQFSRKNELLHQVALQPKYSVFNYSAGIAASIALFFAGYTFFVQPNQVGSYLPNNIAAVFPEVETPDPVLPVDVPTQLDVRKERFGSSETFVASVETPGSTLQNSVNENFTPLERLATPELRAAETTELAALPDFPEPSETQSSPLLELITQESKPIQASYALANNLGQKINTFQKEFRKRDAIEINVFGIQTTIRKPSWMQIRRKN